ncbi:MAG: ribonuclease HI family protein [Nitrososphaerota archaeon]|nr:ribonuclease HI family protein [Nitrososphaerota archaeon]MDG6938306.1 ribonuclease HI family protein [Nitrososphaerota archaeon]MDG6961128.1 ribonuclease HI family protein [Nitrososphaerota archaeon]MDG6968128.1 ribonuclease HI family protein [Nitrososphaerota archaeon]MDG6986613.1 ribonuclease HI family protein [Nitrososphaerota archaeon]
MYVDGLAEPRNPGTGTYGYLIYDGAKKLAEGSGLAGYDVTSNYAEYTALVEALKKLKELALTGDVIVRSDSRLVVGQMSEGWKVKGGMYLDKLKEARDLMKGSGTVRFEWIPRERNQEADLLTRLAYERVRRGSR